MQEIIDVHCHCFAGLNESAQVAAGLARLRSAGVRNLAVMGLVNTRLDVDEIWKLIPEGFDNHGDPLFNEVDALLQFAAESPGMLLPMVDTRCLKGEVETLLQGYVEQGFFGIKGLYLADDGNDLRVASVPEVFGITLQQYHQREWQILAFAEANDLPVVYHMDANRHGDVMSAMLDDFPALRINFPHFGIGRKAFSKILDTYANAYTDIAFMLPHIKSNPASYVDFISHYPDRVCFGSDALLYQADIVFDYIQLVRDMKLPQGLEHRVFAENPRRFLGRGLGTN